MAALDDSYDVYDYCVKLGLDPDSNRNLAYARAKMYAEFWAEVDARNKAAGTGKYAPGYKPSRAGPSMMASLFKARYGRFGP